MSTMSVTEARAALLNVVERVQSGEEITLTRHGVPVAVVVRPDALRARRADAALVRAAGVRTALDRGRRTPLTEVPALDAARAEALVAGVRAGRHGR